jgi:phospholipid/cholesterol/gamma-HCH transport system substrate-binding protein
METRSNHLLVGSVVLAMLVAVLLFVVWLSQASGNTDKQYDIFFKQAVDGLAEGSAVTFSGVPVGQVKSISLVPETPQFVRVRIAVRDSTPILVGTTATMKSVGFTGVSQIQLDPPERDPRRAASAPREIACPEENRRSQCPFDVPVIPTKPGGLSQLLSSAPELLERVSTLTARLTELLSDRNQQSIAASSRTPSRSAETSPSARTRSQRPWRKRASPCARPAARRRSSAPSPTPPTAFSSATPGR